VTHGILLVNLGTPASTAIADVRRYLNEFLMDPYVLDVSWPARRAIVSGFILPFRPKRSSEAYAKVWDAAGPGTGSPLLHYSRLLTGAVGERLGVPCELGMRYGQPSLASALARLEARGVTEVLLVPLYPQFADSTCSTTVRAVTDLAGGGMKLHVLPPFYARPGFIDCLAATVREHLPARWDHLLLSYHGLPERHVTRADPTGSHCLRSPDCCAVRSPAHATCYRHQCFRTSELLADALGIEPARFTVSFQSRLGRLPWLEPYTDHTLAALPGNGVKHLVVACPAFVADNLETLEEIGLAGRKTFLSAGGESFTLVPCLNDRGDWVEALAGWCREAMAGRPSTPTAGAQGREGDDPPG
jgi:protoporphyrin/coproporphyrin ferrochelatase